MGQTVSTQFTKLQSSVKDKIGDLQKEETLEQCQSKCQAKENKRTARYQ